MTNLGSDGLVVSVVSVEPHGEAVVLVVAGEIDVLTAPQFSDALRQALTDRPTLLVIDLIGVTFLASAGLGVLAALAGGGQSNTSVRVVAEGRATARPILLTGLDQVIDLYPSRTAALAGR